MNADISKITKLINARRKRRGCQVTIKEHDVEEVIETLAGIYDIMEQNELSLSRLGDD